MVMLDTTSAQTRSLLRAAGEGWGGGALGGNGKRTPIPAFPRKRGKGQKSAILVTALASALLAACTVGPDYVRPTMPTPERFARNEQPGAVDSTAVEPAATETGATRAGVVAADAASTADTKASDTIATPGSDD